MPHPGTRFNPIALSLAGLVLCSPLPALASAADLYFERGYMAEAGARCGLFTPPVQSALVSAREQARGAALREGASIRDLKSVLERARLRAGSTPCDSPDLAAGARRVRAGFEAYSKVILQQFPGDRLGWKADRSFSRQRANWRLHQDADQGGKRVRFGIVYRAGSDSLMAVAALQGGAEPYAARIVMRDRRLTAGAYLDARGESLRTLDLQRRLPRTGPFESFAAEARSQAPKELLPEGVKMGWAFRFPVEAAVAIAELDPREAILIEFLFGNAPTQRVYLEVGDFAAAWAFLAVARD